MVSYDSQINNLKEQNEKHNEKIEKNNAKIKELEFKKKEAQTGKRVRYVMGGLLVRNGIIIDPDNEDEVNALDSYLNKYSKSIQKQIKDSSNKVENDSSNKVENLTSQTVETFPSAKDTLTPSITEADNVF